MGTMELVVAIGLGDADVLSARARRARARPTL
jgi:hypothetical protein